MLNIDDDDDDGDGDGDGDDDHNFHRKVLFFLVSKHH